jgi:hypothetical protein
MLTSNDLCQPSHLPQPNSRNSWSTVLSAGYHLAKRFSTQPPQCLADSPLARL